jgi:hypothetical protein
MLKLSVSVMLLNIFGEVILKTIKKKILKKLIGI